MAATTIAAHERRHGHDHAGHESGGHAGHAHGVSADADTRKLAIALGLILGFMVIEVVIGVLPHGLPAH